MGFDYAIDLVGARLVLLGGAMVTLLGVLLSALSVGEVRLPPGRRAAAHALPILAVALLATAMRRFDLAVAIVFGASVAMLSAVTGFLALAGPTGKLPTQYRSVWLFLPIAGVLAFVSGFGGEFTIFQAIVLAAEGALLLWVWLDPRNTVAASLEEPAGQISGGWTARPIGSREWSLIIAGIAFAAAGTFLALRGGQRLAHDNNAYPAGVTAGILLSVTLAMPLIRSGSKLAEQGEAWSPMTSAIGVVLINLCATLPLIILFAKLPIAKVEIPGGGMTLEPIAPTFFLPSVWRVDAVVILLLATLLAPVGAGRIKMDRVFGGLLIFAYCAYLMAALWAGVKGQ